VGFVGQPPSTGSASIFHTHARVLDFLTTSVSPKVIAARTFYYWGWGIVLLICMSPH